MKTRISRSPMLAYIRGSRYIREKNADPRAAVRKRLAKEYDVAGETISHNAGFAHRVDMLLANTRLNITLDELLSGKNGLNWQVLNRIVLLPTEEADKEILSLLEMKSKVCSKCHKEKLLEEFRTSTRNPHGRTSLCKQCGNDKNRLWGQKNPDKIKKYLKIHGKKTREKIKNNQELLEKTRAYNREWRKHKYETKPQFRLSVIISSGIANSLKRKGGGKGGRKWEKLVDYSVEDFRRHIESLWEPGMTWENHGRGPDKWHIDHVIPKAAFNFTAPEHLDFKRCWALENLRPAWEEDNLRKGDSLSKPFQPALAITG